MNNRIEIGGAYNLSFDNLINNNDNNFFDYFKKYEYRLYDSGRSALRSLLILDGGILLPEFVCESVIECFNKDHIVFYKINEDFSINVKDLVSKMNEMTSLVYVIHYFGKVHNVKNMIRISKLAKKFKCIFVEDTTQSLLSKHELIGDYGVARIRKWLPIPMGGVLYTKDQSKFMNIKSYEKAKNINIDNMVLKDLYLRNVLEEKIYLNQNYNFEKYLDKQTEIFEISDLSNFLLSCISIPEISYK